MKDIKVQVRNSDMRYKLRVTVYRHVTTPNTVSVNIEEIYPIQPKEPTLESGRHTQIVDNEAEFKAELYPPKK